MSTDTPSPVARRAADEPEVPGGGLRGRPSPQNTGSAPGDEDLAHRLSEMARDLQRITAAPDVMAQLVQTAVALVPGAEHGSISLVRGRRRVSSEGPSGELARVLDRLQDETGQGPCLDAVFEQATVRVVDLAADDRWPELARRAGDAGVRGALCLQLFVEGDDLGALNLVASAPDVFDDESEQVGLLVASHAAIAVADALELEGVRRALAGRDLIGQAKGVLMERFRLTPQQAFDLLARVSQQDNRKLLDVAEELTTTGRLDV